MTAREIVTALFNTKGVTPERIQKAQKLAERSKLTWASVLAAMTPEQRALVEG
jgi:hypothetical protein